MIMARPQFSLRFLLIATTLLAADIAAGIRLMPEADRQNLQLVWVGPVFLAFIAVWGIFVCVATARCCVVVYQFLQHALRFCELLERARPHRSRPR